MQNQEEEISLVKRGLSEEVDKGEEYHSKGRKFEVICFIVFCNELTLILN